MTIRFLIFGKAREEFLRKGYEEYLKRLSKFAKVSIVSLKEEMLPDRPSQGEIDKALDREADTALSRIRKDDALFLLDIHAPSVDSQQLAKDIQEISARKANLVFLVGSSYGLSDRLRQRADISFSLSRMTFTHYMAMLLTMEQVYRGIKIARGETYDK